MKAVKTAKVVMGIFLIVASVVIVIIDLILSKDPEYSFDLEAWHIVAMGFTGIVLMLLPLEAIQKILSRLPWQWSLFTHFF